MEQGQPIVDDVLRQVGQVLSDTVADSGAVFRYGWEDFAVILPAMDMQAAVEVDQLIRLALADATRSARTIR